jgi:two-component system response regulator NreC
MPDEIRLLLVDDHEIVRTGISMLLESETGMNIIGQASTGLQALEMASQLQPDVVIMDITLPDISGIEVTRRLKAQHPGIAVVALTIHEDQQYFFEMLQAGADGYVPKRAASEDLIKAIRAKVLVTDFLTQAAEEKTKESVNGITAREQEVLEMLAAGKTNEEIAVVLSISKHTVARHRENLMRKLGLHSRSELVKYAIRKGLIEP